MMEDEPSELPDSQNNNNHNNHLAESKESSKEVGKSGEVDTDADGEVMSVMKDVSEMEQTNDSSNYSPPPPRKIAKRSKGSNRKSTSSPRLKVPTPTSIMGSSSEREPNSSPASNENPTTNGSANVGDKKIQFFGVQNQSIDHRCKQIFFFTLLERWRW